MMSDGTAAEVKAQRLAVEWASGVCSEKGVATLVGAHPLRVSGWVACYRADGDDGLRAKTTPGRPRTMRPPIRRGGPAGGRPAYPGSEATKPRSRDYSFDSNNNRFSYLPHS
jgi:hypothetical protein